MSFLDYPIPVGSVGGDNSLTLRHNRAWDRVAVYANQGWQPDGNTEVFLDAHGLRVLIAAAQVMLSRLEAAVVSET